ncbi:thioredoxin-like [Folsomia candida]|uniref:thioredoxin-like n=1 Tax=Folsomia candida TaxID=158441 RepID=UPI000B8FB9AC|nr:thioredoxin-like [Folsomia candida]
MFPKFGGVFNSVILALFVITVISVKKVSAEVHEIKSTAEFDNFLQSGVFAANFYADWCGQCSDLAPQFDQLSRDYPNSVSFVKIDADAVNELARKYGVRTLPTTIIFRDGHLQRTVPGARIEPIKQAILSELE